MGYPQPDSDQAVTNGEKVFRLHTTLVSPGDTYDSKQSGYGFAIGPDSDIANVSIAYYDQTLATRMNQVTIGVDSPYVGLLQARLDPGATYQPQGVAGRIIFTLDDVVPALPAYAPPAENTMRIPPVLDILQYLSPPPGSIVAPRNDKNYLFFASAIDGFPSHQAIYEIPYYGRKYGMITLRGAVGTMHGQIDGLQLQAGVSDGLFAVVPILADTDISSVTVPKIFTDDTYGLFDYIRVTLTSADPSAVGGFEARFSDRR